MPEPTPEPDPMPEPEPTVPGTMAAPTLEVGDEELIATWTAPNNGSSTVTGYELQYRSGDEEWMKITEGITDEYHSIIGLTNGTAYEVQVRAVNAVGAGDWSESAAATPVTVPDAPAAPTLYPGTGRIVARWTAPEDTGGSAVTGYELQYRTGGEAWTEISSGITGTDHAITNLTNGAPYAVQVRAVNNAVGAGPWSEPVAGTPLFSPTQTPSGTEKSISLSVAQNAIIANENLSVSLTTGTHAVNDSGDLKVKPRTTPNGVTPPTVDTNTGIVTVTASTTAGTYLVYGSETESGDIVFAEYFYVTVSPTTNAELKTAVTSGISNWGDTADLNYIITTAVTDMSDIFSREQTFNGDIAGWDVSKVTDMNNMFYFAVAFNGDISGWDVSSVTNMNNLFRLATSFNGNISGWNVSSVTTMRDMFNVASVFNGNISGWDVSSVTNMSSMFSGASAFNGDISGWDVSSVTNMNNMFSSTSAFNGNISGWNVSKVTTMSAMFSGASAFNGDISGWDVSSVTNMGSMFSSASAFNGDISLWNTVAVTNMSSMFSDASTFNGDVSGWVVSSVTNMGSMFNGASAFNGDISGWVVSSVTNMSSMFNGASAFNGDLEEWKDHWTLSGGKYTGSKNDMFADSGVTGSLIPSWY